MFQWARTLLGLGGQKSAVTAPSGGGFQARYDNATTTDENRRNWWAADYLSAKAANSFAVRRTLRMRSRYEVSNNPFLFGIVSNNADDLISTGPTLQLRTADDGYNRLVEASWREWCAEVDLVEKLRTAKLAKTIDGEGFLILKTVSDMDHPVKLYPCDVEADQVTTPAPKNIEQLWVDGLILHPVTGKPKSFTVLRHHPGDYYFPDLNPLRYDTISAQHVIHWYGKFRPGQVRGIPTFTSSLDIFAELRAYRRAVLGAAELAADFAAVIEQDKEAGAYSDEDTDEEIEAFKRVPIDRKMMTALPPGAKMSQFNPKQPTTSYEMFQEKCLGEACRPLSFPLIRALGTSQKANFSSAKLDYTDYRNGLDVERGECNSITLAKIFRNWFLEATLCGAIPMWNGAMVPPHEWHWPGYAALDPVAEATANASLITNGLLTRQQYFASRGFDWRVMLKQFSDEAEEIRRLALQFGEPAALTIHEDGDPPATAAKRLVAMAERIIRAMKADAPEVALAG